ncbi:methyl-accepting chemotaxis protein [Sporomusa aerivorans]|uniref:methyl-accepting chemotaxis protein n=1 Tax=Sporomusa aerivorans TaxID=204936 RepID=UPI00352B41E3
MKLTVGRKITGGFLLVIVMVAIMSIFTYLEIGELNAAYESLLATSLRKMELTQSFATDLANEAVAMRRFNFTGDPADIVAFNDYRKKSDQEMIQLNDIMQTEKGKNLLQVMRKEKAEYEAIAEKSIEAKKANNLEKVSLYMQEAGRPYKAAIAASDELVQTVKAVVQDEQKSQKERAAEVKLMLLVVNVLVTFVAIGIGLFISRSISRPIGQITCSANELAKGNLLEEDIIQKSSDEIGQLAAAFNIMKHNLHQLIKQVIVTTEQVAASSEELTASAEQSARVTVQVAETIGDVAQGAENQANEINATSEILEKLSTGIQQVAVNIDTVSGMADKTAGTASQGNKAVDAAMDQMQSIEKSVSDSARVVMNLGERSKEIGQIVDTISGIAGQTNLLALNAAIEAARAGEQGRGFAVVAEEVRKLAEQSQHAAKEIAGLIAQIQAETDSAVVAMTSGTEEVKVGSEVVNTAGLAFKEIVSLIAEVSTEIKEVSETIKEMAAGSQQIVTAVRDIDQISKEAAGQTQTVAAATEEQSASMEEIAASSQALAKIAEELQDAVSIFKV